MFNTANYRPWFIAMATHLACHFYPKECQSSTSSPEMHKTVNTLFSNTLYFTNLYIAWQFFRFSNAKRLSFVAKLCSWWRDCRPKGLRILRNTILKRFPGSKIIHCMFAKDVLFPDRRAEKLFHTSLIDHRTQAIKCWELIIVLHRTGQTFSCRLKASDFHHYKRFKLFYPQ